MRKGILWLLFISALPAIILFIYYTSYAGLENRLRTEEGYSIMQANAIKHAYASLGVYRTLKHAGVSDVMAEKAVFQLGIFNEWLESIIYKGSSADAREEIMRDLHNNWAGMSAAQWQWYNADKVSTGGLKLIKELMRQQVLLADRPSLSYEVSGMSDQSLAENWLSPRLSVIRSDVQNALERTFLNRDENSSQPMTSSPPM